MNKTINKNLTIIFITITIFFIVSILSIYSSKYIVSSIYNNLYLKQLIWYLIGIISLIFIIRIKNKILLRLAYPIYFFNIILLILVLFWGQEINNAKCWFQIPYLGNFQPSEIMKISLILVLSKEGKHFFNKENDLRNEIIFIIKVFVLTIIPCFLTFIEPDTGTIVFFLLIAITSLFVSGLRIKWFLLFLSIMIIIGTLFFIIYFNYQNLFVNIFGHSFFYRIHRLFDWTNSSGMQLENSMIAIGSSYIFGHGLNNTPIYFPEPYTDFIFSIFTSNFGFLGGIMLIITILIFLYSIFYIDIKVNSITNKLIITMILSIFVFSYIQNISMTIGLLPIMGIPLPFISYGGSNLITSFVMLGIIVNIVIEKKQRIIRCS